MLNQSKYMELDAVGLAEGLKNRDFSCVDVTRNAIDRAKQVNPKLNAIVTEDYAAALQQAQNIDQNPQLLDRSRVAGIPFLIKDLSAVKGLPCGYGSKLYRGYIPQHNANIVSRYLDAGLNLLGKTNTPEWGLTLTTEPLANGICRNPWNSEYSVGGSSGGAAAAVAAGIVPVAHAADGGGSIRIPAACCGLFGLKPSRGLSTIESDYTGSWGGLSVGHVVSQTVRDSAAFLDLIRLDQAKLFPLPSSPSSFYEAIDTNPGKLRIALQLQHPGGESIDADCINAVKHAADICSSLGHDVDEVKHPLEYGPVISAMSRIINTSVYQSIAPRLQELGLILENSPLETSTKIMARSGSKVSAVSYIAAQDLLRQTQTQMSEFHQQYDLILSPVLTKTTAKVGWLDMNSEDSKEYISRFRQYSGFTAIYNGTGQPSMSIPLYRDSAGLPIGVMFSGAWGKDSLLLQLARQIESSNPWPRTAPPVPQRSNTTNP